MNPETIARCKAILEEINTTPEQKEEMLKRIAELERKQEARPKVDIDAPVYIRLNDGRLIQNGTMLDIPRVPVPKSLDRIVRFDALARGPRFPGWASAAMREEKDKEQRREAMYEWLSRYNLANPAVRKVVVAIVCIIIFGLMFWIGGQSHNPPVSTDDVY
jgi:hypothetical protein